MTKGPWRYDPGFSSGAILGADDEIVAEGVRLEDATVILAAPRMLEALRRAGELADEYEAAARKAPLGAVMHGGPFDGVPVFDYHMRLARMLREYLPAAIAKTEGREP